MHVRASESLRPRSNSMALERQVLGQHRARHSGEHPLDGVPGSAPTRRGSPPAATFRRPRSTTARVAPRRHPARSSRASPPRPRASAASSAREATAATARAHARGCALADAASARCSAPATSPPTCRATARSIRCPDASAWLIAACGPGCRSYCPSRSRPGASLISPRRARMRRIASASPELARLRRRDSAWTLDARAPAARGLRSPRRPPRHGRRVLRPHLRGASAPGATPRPSASRTARRRVD